MTTRALPEGRYGKVGGRASARWRRWLFAAVALVAGVVVAWVAYVNLGPAPIQADRVSFAEQPGNAMSITINVTRDDPGRPGVCIVRLRDISGAESGRKEVYIPAGDNHSMQTTVVRSIDRPVDADVFGCSYDVPSYLSSS
ncbi:hypothetical protein FHX82_001667 [Amycolatopsis bartoniae]|uniref:DUF4307 domain-containing protein n=1 Tax=Amycolatopsis bartoniae TaxID=941986 RepID=A0A8H9IXC5_9PSEU|nr:DUF4307 domain-containing protein [Amycolatopsis bartoniae]MBB2934647.1 hypothetical protein [Amycolatopsis bartoniae]TVT09310.1 DUF4307 domain-containing protein [Amycolatopsis bartoniae]GHF45843.1 hypothetical protein GCM10017566_18620 [Amycolatopsis bartoniae]